MFRRAKRFLTDASGATAIEYGLIVGLIFLAIVASMASLQGSLENTYTKISNAVANAGN
jgi:pilus assembly protein Flp/PilA